MRKLKYLLIVITIFSNISLVFSAPLFQEDFEDANLASRGWYDNTNLQLSTIEHILGSTASVEYHFLQGATTPISGGGIRKAFTATESVYVRYWVKYSANYTGSNQPYHPHEIMLLTNANGAWDGLSDTYMTAYIEQNEGTPTLNLQDSQNIDESNISVDLTGETENRAVAGCNGTPNAGYTYTSCYGSVGNHRNEIWYSANQIYFSDSPGPYYKNDWHKIEVYFEMNSIVGGVGTANGVMKYWYDGQLIIDKNNVLFRTGQNPSMAFNQFIIAPWIGDGSPVDQTMWVDDLYVATSKPSSLPRPSPPSNLTIQ